MFGLNYYGDLSALTAVWFTMLVQTDAHGYMIDPPARASMWRDGFKTPVNYNDNKLFCGGFGVQWNINGGRCGICGDPYNGVRQNEAGGLYATGTIARNYTEGQTIPVNVYLTMNHGGYFEFRICPNNNPSKAATKSCLDRHLLRSTTGQTRMKITAGVTGMISHQVVLPRGLTCSQCVLQWKWNTASNWGCDAGGCGHDHGNQEQYYNCADVAISPTSTSGSGNVRPTFSTGNSIITSGSSSSSQCEAVPEWKAKYAYADEWCTTQCAAGNCPVKYCQDKCRQNSLMFG